MNPLHIATIALHIATGTIGLAASPLEVWFDQPGKSFHEATVQGNGRLGDKSPCDPTAPSNPTDQLSTFRDAPALLILIFP